MTALLVILALALIAVGTAGIVYPALPGLALMFAGTWLLAYLRRLSNLRRRHLVDGRTHQPWRHTGGLYGRHVGGKIHWGRQTRRPRCIGKQHHRHIFLPARADTYPFIGAAAGELIDRRNMLQAGKAGLGTLLGLVVGTAFKIGCAVSILLILLVKYIAYLF